MYSSFYSLAVMQKCWSEDAEERPSFAELSSIMESLLTSVADYTALGMALTHTHDPIGTC